ncbi:hypothetical protein [Methylotenera sp.]|uniref:hypothetical protein n=1 Tax=Methylotenera sp. TaxID=2051956 RepID=UPI002487FDD7|nr:hypothetical protein [Methylotenera sp.]MDI1363145.1 hypothetical protein [Methylotenera sp.]
MIIAAFGHYKYKLKDIADAEQLLKIINDSVQVDEHYLRGSGSIFSILKNSSQMNLSIIQSDLISEEDLEKLREQELQKAQV